MSFMFKENIMLGVSALMVLSLGACRNSEGVLEGDTSTGSSLDNKDVAASIILDGESSERNNEKTDVDSDSSVLIAYFSWSGNTKQLADLL